MNILDVQGSTSEGNIQVLRKYALLSVISNPHPVIADIGTCAGKSAIAIASMNPDIIVLTVDPLLHPSLQESLSRFGVQDQVAFFVMTSEEFGPECPPLDMCFIDGVHSYEGVRKDIENIVSKVKLGGYVLFHDCNLYDNTVRVAVEEFNGIEYEFIEEVGGRVEEPKEGSIWVGRKL